MLIECRDTKLTSWLNSAAAPTQCRLEYARGKDQIGHGEWLPISQIFAIQFMVDVGNNAWGAGTHWIVKK